MTKTALDLLTNRIGDKSESPNLFFVRIRGKVHLISLDYWAADDYFDTLRLQNIEATLEDCETGLIAASLATECGVGTVIPDNRAPYKKRV